MTEATQEANVDESGAAVAASESSMPLFPHDIPTEHWDINYNDTNESYEGTALPIWILAGWAVFILWAVIYLLFGLPTAF